MSTNNVPQAASPSAPKKAPPLTAKEMVIGAIVLGGICMFVTDRPSRANQRSAISGPSYYVVNDPYQTVSDGPMLRHGYNQFSSYLEPDVTYVAVPGSNTQPSGSGSIGSNYPHTSPRMPETTSASQMEAERMLSRNTGKDLGDIHNGVSVNNASEQTGFSGVGSF